MADQTTSYIIHTGQPTRNVWPNILLRYALWTTDKEWLVKHLVTLCTLDNRLTDKKWLVKHLVTLCTLDNRLTDGQTSCYVLDTDQPTRNGRSNILLPFGHWSTDKKWLVKQLKICTLDNRQEIAGQTSCYVMDTGQSTRNGWPNILLRFGH